MPKRRIKIYFRIFGSILKFNETKSLHRYFSIRWLFYKEFEEWSIRLFEDFKSGKRIAVISDITLDELSDAPQRVKDFFKTIPEIFLEVVISDSESEKLADLYVIEGAVSRKFYEDALHIAISTINQVSVLAS